MRYSGSVQDLIYPSANDVAKAVVAASAVLAEDPLTIHRGVGVRTRFAALEALRRAYPLPEWDTLGRTVGMPHTARARLQSAMRAPWWRDTGVAAVAAALSELGLEATSLISAAKPQRAVGEKPATPAAAAPAPTPPPRRELAPAILSRAVIVERPAAAPSARPAATTIITGLEARILGALERCNLRVPSLATILDVKEIHVGSAVRELERQGRIVAPPADDRGERERCWALVRG